MKKLFLLLICMVTICIMPFSFQKANATEEGQPSKTTENVYFYEMINYTSLNQGENYTNYELVDFGVKHGNVANGSINKFLKYSADESKTSNSLGSSADNTYTEEHWKIHSQNNDGFIFEFIAKYPVTITIEKEKIGGDWVEAANLNVYKKNTNGTILIKNVELAANTPASSYGIEIDLAVGEILYWEFIFEWAPHRNMINLPSATFIYNKNVNPSEPEEPVIPENTPSKTSESVSFPDVVNFTAKEQGNNYTSYELVYFGVKHGNVSNGNIQKFTKYTHDASTWSSTLGSTSDNAYADTHWRIYTRNNDGVIFEFTAKYPIKVSIVRDTIGGDWVADANLNIYKKCENDLTTIKSVAITEETPKEEFGVEVNLNAGETLYWEFVFEWADLRHMIHMPTATFTYIEPHVCEFDDTWINDDKYHWHECSCGEIDQKAEHSGGEATETEEALCEVCGASYGELLNHTHTYSTEWTYDETHHWYAATCEHTDSKSEFAKHSLEWSTVTEPTLLEDGEEKGVCSCGYEESRVIEAILPDYPDYSTLNEIGLNDLAIGVAINKGNPVILDSMEINLLQGNVLTNTKGFSNYIVDNSEKLSVLISDTNQFDGERSAAFTTWRIKTTNNNAAIFEIKATEDIKLTISHPAFNEGWIDEHGQYFGLYLKANDKVFTQWEREIKTNVAIENQYGGTIMLKAGDICYYVFGSTIANERNVNIVPTFNASKEDYNEEERKGQMTLADETVNMWDALTATINNNYIDVDYNTITYGFYYGNVKELHQFDTHVGDGSGTPEDALWDSVAQQTGYLRWQMQCSAGKNAIIKITAKENVSLNIYQPTPEGDEAAFKVNWATFTAIRYYALDTDGTIVLINNIPVVAGMPLDYFNLSINLAKGQTLLIDYYTSNDEWGSLDYRPITIASTEDFDETKLVDFSAIKALDGLKAEKIEELNEMLDGLNEFDYSINNWGKIQNFFDEAIVEIEEAQSAEQINTIYSGAITNVKAVKTSAMEKVELDAYKKSKIEELNALLSSLDKNRYTEENYKLITDKVADITEKINKARNKTNVDTLLANTKTYINNIPASEAPVTQNGCAGGCAGGCSGSIVTSVFGIMMLLSVVIIIKKKKLTDK